MIAEIAIVASLALAGGGILAGFSRPVPAAARITLALPVGAGIYLISALTLIVLTGTLDPLTAVRVLVITGLIGWGWAGRRRPAKETWRTAGLTIGLAVLVAVIFRIVHLTRLTPDSMRYLLAANDLVRPDGLIEMNRPDLLIRQIGLPSLHALAHLSNRPYLASIAPAFGLSGLGFFAWLSWDGTRTLDRKQRWRLVAAATLFLGASNRLVYDSFYINTHIQMAVYLLIAVAGCWLAVSKGVNAWSIPAGIALGATLLLRPEAPLVAAIVLVGVAASRAGWAVRIATLLPTVVVAALWYGVALRRHAPGGDVISLTAPVFGSLMAITGAATVVLAGGFRRLRSVIRHADKALYVALVGLLVILGNGRYQILIDSVEVTVLNLTYQGMWLLAWPAALVLLVGALLTKRVTEAKMWTVPILGFGLLFWLLPLLRGGPYRTGTGDSGNRIVAHIFPVLVAFLVLAAVDASPADELTPLESDRVS